LGRGGFQQPDEARGNFPGIFSCKSRHIIDKADMQTVTVASEAYYAKNGYWATGYTDDTTFSPTHVGLVPAFLQAAPNGGGKYTITYYNAATATAAQPEGSVAGALAGGGAC